MSVTGLEEKIQDIAIRVELIKHISKDIEKLADYVATFRSRIALTVMIGPFVALGSLALNSKNQTMPVKVHACNLVWPLLCLACTYSAIAWLAARLDHHAITQSDAWRTLLLKVATGSVPNENEIKMTQVDGDIFKCYIWSFLLTLGSFICLGYIILSVNGAIHTGHQW
jgi:hypothetical protein